MPWENFQTARRNPHFFALIAFFMQTPSFFHYKFRQKGEEVEVFIPFQILKRRTKNR